MAKILELSHQEFKITMTNMLVALMETNVQKQMDNVSRDGNSKNQTEMLEIKSTAA